MNVLVLYAYETVAIILVENAKVHRAIIVIVTIIITVNRHTLHMLMTVFRTPAERCQ